MKDYEISNVIGEIDSRHVAEAAVYDPSKSHKVRFVKGLTVAACFVMCVLIGWGVWRYGGNGLLTDNDKIIGETNQEDTTVGGGNSSLHMGQNNNQPLSEDKEDFPQLSIFDSTVHVYVGGDVWEFENNSFSENVNKFIFTSSDETIATVSDSGVVRGISPGETEITVVAVNYKLKTIAKFSVVVLEPFVPTKPIDIELWDIMETKTEYKTYRPYLTNVTTAKGPDGVVGKYNECEYDVDYCKDGPVEIWNNTLVFNFILGSEEVDATRGIENSSSYNWYFDVYFKPYTELQGGDYKKATLQAVACDKSQDILYRCLFYDSALGWQNDLYTEFDMKIVVREGKEVKGWFDMQMVDWSDSCFGYMYYAEEHWEEIRK